MFAVTMAPGAGEDEFREAAKACLALLNSEGASTFKSTYATFGACVSAKAKA